MPRHLREQDLKKGDIEERPSTQSHQEAAGDGVTCTLGTKLYINTTVIQKKTMISYLIIATSLSSSSSVNC